MKGALIILLLLLGSTTFSKGSSGYYFLEGTAYSANENVLKNALLSFYISETTYEFTTDEHGYFKTKTPWRTPCRSGVSDVEARKLSRKFNPEKIMFSFKCQGIQVKNYWLEYRDAYFNEEKSNVKKMDLHFKN